MEERQLKVCELSNSGKNTITIKVEPAAGSDKEGSEYTFTVDCMPTLTGITAESGGTELYLDKQFSSSVSGYILTIPEKAETVDMTAVPKNQGYTILYNGKESPAVDVKGREKIEITVSAGSGDGRLKNTYTFDLRRAAKLDFKADVTPDDAIVKVYDSEGAEVGE
ncbi:MAG: cadherin-like beta sandwich domain-containing protein [Clostridia bacterium]